MPVLWWTRSDAFHKPSYRQASRTSISAGVKYIKENKKRIMFVVAVQIVESQKKKYRTKLMAWKKGR